jgi:penicillin-binding protein 1A
MDDHTGSRSRLPSCLGRVAAGTVSGLVLVGATGLLGGLLLTPFLLVVDDTLSATRQQVLDRPPLPDELPTAAEVSVVHAADGTELAELSGPVRRQVVPLEDVPDVVIDAVVATEDARFFEHDGVDHRSMLRAAGRNVVAGDITEGASTITQQLVRMTLLDPEQTLERKVHEIVWALDLEEQLGKEEILEHYLNGIYLGQGAYGVATAAEHYFSKPVAELTLAEAALLAGTIRAPAVANPVSDPDAALARRDVVLEQMRSQGLASAEEADEALAQDLALDVAERERGQPFWDDLVARLIHDPALDLQPGVQEAVGETQEERLLALHEGGLTIETTLDPHLQGHAEATLAEYLDDPVDDPLGSLLTVEHATGAVRALALGPREYGACPDDEDGPCELTQINPTVPGAGSAGRQSGSAFKPFIAAAALANGIDADEEYDSPSGEPIEGCGEVDEDWAPQNFRDEDAGEVAMSEALESSVNVYFAKLARDIGVETVVDVALAHGLVHSPNLRDFSGRMCSIALGTAAVYPLDMAVGYGVWANDGVRCEPYLIERILDRHGEVLYAHEPRCEQAIDPEVAAEMRELLREPVGPDGTAPVVGDRLGDGVFGKTGTTNDHADAWFVGSDGPYTTATWVGYEHPEPMVDVEVHGEVLDAVTGSRLPAPIFAAYHEHLD